MSIQNELSQEAIQHSLEHNLLLFNAAISTLLGKTFVVSDTTETLIRACAESIYHDIQQARKDK